MICEGNFFFPRFADNYVPLAHNHSRDQKTEVRERRPGHGSTITSLPQSRISAICCVLRSGHYDGEKIINNFFSDTPMNSFSA